MIINKNYCAYIELERKDVAKIENMIAQIQNDLNCTRWGAIVQLFMWGFEIGASKLEKESERAEIRRILINRRLADILDQERGYNKRVHAAVRELGYDQALAVAQREGLDMEEVKGIIEKAKPRPEDMTQLDQMISWIDTIMASGERISVKKIKDMAMDDEILPPDTDGEEWQRSWDMLRRAASRGGYSGGQRGYWQKRDARRLDD